MLQRFRDNLKGTVATILVGLMIIPFALFGVDSLFVSNTNVGKAAIVNGEEISEQELARAIYMQKQQLISRMGNNVPPEFLTDERLRGPVLNDLVQRALLAQTAREGGMAISDADLDQLILQAEQFQLDGNFDRDTYTQLLRAMGFTPSSYKRQVERDVLLDQLSRGVTDSAFLTSSELAQQVALAQQTRDFYYLTIPQAKVAESVSVSAEEVEAHYQANQEAYRAPEQVAVEYIEMSPQTFATDIELSDEQLQEQFEQELAAFEVVTERHAAHILIEPKEDGAEQQILADIQARLQTGEAFADLAAELSDDLGSREQGGDLGFSSGDAYPEAFEAALAKLSVDEVSAPVETESGFHLIKLLAQQSTQPPKFEDEKARIAADLMRVETETLFGDALERLEDLSYNADSLKEVAAELGVTSEVSGLFARSGATGFAANPLVSTAAFDEDVLAGNSSEMLELGDNHVAVLRVVEHKASHIKALTDVQAEVEQQLKRQETQRLLAEQGKTLQARVEAGESVESVAKAESLEWQLSTETQRRSIEVNRQLLGHVFTLPKPEQGKAEVGGLQLDSGDYVLVQLTAVTAGDHAGLAEAQKNSMLTRLVSNLGRADYQSYQSALEQTADIER